MQRDLYITHSHSHVVSSSSLPLSITIIHNFILGPTAVLQDKRTFIGLCDLFASHPLSPTFDSFRSIFLFHCVHLIYALFLSTQSTSMSRWFFVNWVGPKITFAHIRTYNVTIMIIITVMVFVRKFIDGLGKKKIQEKSCHSPRNNIHTHLTTNASGNSSSHSQWLGQGRCKAKENT